MRDRDHLDHLPGRAYLLVVGGAALLPAAIGAWQMLTSSDWATSVLWGGVLALGAISLLSLAVAWEERRAHIHALVRQALEDDPTGRTEVAHAAALAELMRLGAHRELELVRRHAGGEG